MKKKEIDFFLPDSKPCNFPELYESRVQAGFPSPAEDYIEKKLDLNELCVAHPAATFYIRVQGESMVDANIHSGDIVVVDRALQPASGKIVLAVLDNEFTIKRLLKKNNKWILQPENKNYKAIEINKNSEFEVWGIVTFIIHQAK